MANRFKSCPGLLFATFLVILMGNRSVWSQDGPFADPSWRYQLSEPGAGWQTERYDDSNWHDGPGGFGTPGTPGSRVGTLWKTNQIWLRRQVELPSIPERPALLIHHDEDATVYLNGHEVVRLPGYSTKYEVVPLDDRARRWVRKGENLIAVSCKQTGGGQFIDVHLIDADHVPQLPRPARPDHPFQTTLITTWGAQVTDANAWQAYPRPTMVRDKWINLNGSWDYAVTDIESKLPTDWEGKIRVPFCLESRLSGVQRLLYDDQALWYRRTVDLQPEPDQRTLLNFEAVDYRCEVWVNGSSVGSHTGGNTPFTLDVTRAARLGANEIVVRVEDATGGTQLRGKQRVEPEGIFYTRVSGIWQTVWLEQVPRTRIDRMTISTDPDQGTVRIQGVLRGDSLPGFVMQAVLRDGDAIIDRQSGTPGDASVQLTVPNPRLWSPQDPHLYDLEIRLVSADGQTIDRVRSYAGIRSVGKLRDRDGHLRFALNGKPLFHYGVLDQGWWPDGLLTPPSEQAIRNDIRFVKESGFNLIRKHVKVEPRRFYYLCDKLGVLVWQDQVAAFKNPAWTRLNPTPVDADWSDAEHAQFMTEFAEMIDALENHPSIVVWTPFNEAWGQHRTMEVGRWVARRDLSRLINIACGGNFWPVGDVASDHHYPTPGFSQPDRFGDYIKVVGEFGGHGMAVPGHVFFDSSQNWGYGGLAQDSAELLRRYRESVHHLAQLKRQGIAGGVYTQLTDVEGELNGLMTYDRKQNKIAPPVLREINRQLLDGGDGGAQKYQNE